MKIYSAKKSSDTKKIICLCCKLVIEQPMNSPQKVKQSRELSRQDFPLGELVHRENEQPIYQISHFLFDIFDHLQWRLQLLSLSALLEGYLFETHEYLKQNILRTVYSQPWTKHFLIVFKLADRMRSMRTNGASKNRDWSNQNGTDFPHGQIQKKLKYLWYVTV